MDTRNYFLETPAEERSLKAAFQELEISNSSSEACVNLRTLKKHTIEAKSSNNHEVAPLGDFD